ncbi:MAG: single-stranded-DNA-specific exonuclease RecJ [Candidatus Contendobacter sp.]|nr:single-stranded-DNA-specific exonuclease RecJ [Candidatus Contendobacter sp.]MDS4060104.1 single-stranded-DNA-specific exonuclease RecJ [Candidatus Contendobacter sp.]
MPPVIIRRPGSATVDLPVSPLLQRIYAARGVDSIDQLDQRLRMLPSPASLAGLTEAVTLLEDALRQRWRITIVADLDADGATSCALAVRALRALGAADVRYVVPNRFVHGYGLTPEIVAVAARDRPDLLITVDNGISSHEGVRAAQALGMRVLITDHHLPGPTLPAADALVNPNQPGDAFPCKQLAGVGVIFYVLSALRTRLRESGWFAARGLSEPNMAGFLDLVAVGTVADVVPLAHANRVLVEQGLRRIREGRCVPGISALFAVAGRSMARASVTDIAFQLGPRLNAAGRLADMSLSIDCLLCDDPARALVLAQELDRLNRERRMIETEMRAQALDSLERWPLAEGELPFGLCLFDPDWHPGVIGIVAGRIRERVHRPVIAFALDHHPGQLRGSARSVPGLHIRDVLATLDARQPGLIGRFGGHAAAAGLSLPAAHLSAFQSAFDAEVRALLRLEDLNGCLWSDGELEPADFCLETAEQLREAGPWGQGFPEPLFDGVFEVTAHRIMKEQHLKLWLRAPGLRQPVEAVAFHRVGDFTPGATRLRVAYKLDANEWRGERRLQLRVEHLEPV